MNHFKSLKVNLRNRNINYHMIEISLQVSDENYSDGNTVKVGT